MLAIYTDFCASTSFSMQLLVTTETATTHGTGRDKAPSLRQTITSIKFLFEGCKKLICHSLIANNINSAFCREMLLVMPIWTPWTMQVLLKACISAAVGLETAPQSRAWMEHGKIGTELATTSRYCLNELRGTCFDFFSQELNKYAFRSSCAGHSWTEGLKLSGLSFQERWGGEKGLICLYLFP